MTDRVSTNSFDLRWLRSATDLAVAFVIAVILLRAFVLEGYLISTGSMAPGLLGFHRRIVCPSCEMAFAYGVSFDDSVAGGEGSIREPVGTRALAMCPNCGQTDISVTGVPNSHGDQLLVHKHLFDIRAPRRWEPVVFRDPSGPDQPFVKRVVGLPGERIRLGNGDVLINGELVRKSYDQQRAMRIPVCDIKHLARSEDWQMPWESDEGWTVQDGELHVRAADVQWLRFRHWRWSGGHHITETPLSAADGQDDWQRFLDRFEDLPVTWTSRVQFDAAREVLLCEGVMPQPLQDDLLKQARSTEFRRAVHRLAALSHVAPVTDRYGYNALISAAEYVVDDLMLVVDLAWVETPRCVRVSVPVENEVFEVRLFPADGKIELRDDAAECVARATYSTPKDRPAPATVRLEVSNFDRQVVVAVDEVPVFEPLPAGVETRPFSTSTEPAAEALQAGTDGISTSVRTRASDDFLEASASTVSGTRIDLDQARELALHVERQKRWAVGIEGGAVRVQGLSMYRDVYYTPGRRTNAVDRELEIPAGNYFVLGDNSPVSSDSRNWSRPCVPHELLIGKPFVLHLPSRPGVLQFAGRDWPIRIPDWPRMHYIR
jgi:signal peptidase I